MDDNRNYAKQFKETCDLYGKGKSAEERKYYHFKLSIDPYDSPTPEQSHELAEKLAQELFSAHECVIATHNDTDVIHSHIIVNAVSFETGKKLRLNNAEYAHCKDRADDIGRYDMGFSPLNWRDKVKKRKSHLEVDYAHEAKTMSSAEIQIAKRQRDGDNENGTSSWKEALRQAIDEAKKYSASRAEFERYLADNFGVTMSRNTTNTVTFIYPTMGENYAVRGAKLGGGYTALEIDKALKKNVDKFKAMANKSIPSLWDLEPNEQPSLQVLPLSQAPPISQTPLHTSATQPLQKSEESKLRTYFAEFNDPDIFNRLEIIHAHTDDEAIEQALAFVDEYDGVALLQLTEIDDNSNIIRRIEFEQSLAYELEEADEVHNSESQTDFPSRPQQVSPTSKPQTQTQQPQQILPLQPKPRKRNRGMDR